MNQTKPGFNSKDQHNSEWPDMSRQIIDFMPRDKVASILDVGEKGYKSDQLSRFWDVDQLVTEDFNFPFSHPKKYPVITCFEVIEHIQNPLLFFYNLTLILEKDGVIYLTTPCRPKFLWPSYHFYEMSPAHLQKWIFEPCGYTIKRKKKLEIRDGVHWYTKFTGIRPIIRSFWNYTWIYEIGSQTSNEGVRSQND